MNPGSRALPSARVAAPASRPRFARGWYWVFGPDAEHFLQSRSSRVRRTRWRREGDFEPSLSVEGQQVAKPEGITTDLLADGKLYRTAEGRPIKNKGVKLSILAARVNLRRKLREKL